MAPIYSALIGIGGILLGSVLTYFSQNMLLRKKTVLKFAEKVIDKRLEAYDKIYIVIKKLRIMTQVGYEKNENPNELIVRKPMILSDYNTLSMFITEMNNVYSQYSQWYDIELTRTYYFYQDYIINCSSYYASLTDNIEEFSISLKTDFIELGLMFDKAILNFYTKDLYKINKKVDSYKWHKLKKAETIKLLENTVLFRKYLKSNFEMKK